MSGQTAEVTENTHGVTTVSQAETSIETPAEESVDAVDLTSCFVDQSNNIVYLKTAVTAAVVDADATNHTPAESAGEKAELSAGTILHPADLQPGDIVTFSANMDFITFQGARVHIDTAVSADGSVLFAGKTIADMFGGAYERTDEIAENYQQTEDVDEIVLKPWETLDPRAFYTKIVVRIDWNNDGTEDELCQTNEDDLSNTFTYTDGKTGEVTDLNALVLVPENDDSGTGKDDKVGLKLDSTSLVVQNSNGEYGILSSIYSDERGYATYAFRYDAETLFACKGIGSAYSYLDGKFYCHPYTNCLGNQWVMNQTAELSDDFSFVKLSGSEYYSQSPYYTYVVYTKTPVNIDISDGSGYKPSTLAPGIVILPDRLETDENGTTYLYVNLADGQEGRFTYTADETGYPVYLNGVEQEEMFGGLVFGG